MNKINLLNDFFIRYLLASKGDEDILENIVNAVLTNIGFETVHNLEIINPYNLKDNQYLKESILALWEYRFFKKNLLLYIKKYSFRIKN